MNTHYHVVEAFIKTLTAQGITSFVVSPGSRSTPLAVYAARKARANRATLHMIVDERSAGFFALGTAKALRKPAVLICTSGTAGANYLPAVVEAHYSHTPLIVLTADRPPELRDVGAAQTIDQVGMYDSFVRWSVDMPLPQNADDVGHYFSTVALRAVAESTGTPAGPVHINFPFREPLIPPPVNAAEFTLGRGDRTITYGSWPQPSPGPTPDVDDSFLHSLAMDIINSGRGILICGPQPAPELAPHVVNLAATLGIPLLADPLSQVRFGLHPSSADSRSVVIDAYDTFLRDPSIQEVLSPDYVIRLGALPTSKPLNTYLKSRAARHIVVDPNAWNDPLLCATDMVRCDPLTFCRHVTSVADYELNRQSPGQGDSSAGDTKKDHQRWLDMWRQINKDTRLHLSKAVSSLPGMFEGRLFTELHSHLPEECVLFVGNSMPVRDMDTFMGLSDKTIYTMANRGANGIDGVISTALGSASAGQKPLVLVLGDLSMLHDLGGLAAAKACHTPVAIIVVNNDGGGIFSFLPQAKEVEDFEQLFGTPHGIRFKHAAGLFDLPYTQPGNWEEFRKSVAESLNHSGVSIIELTTDRTSNVAMHRDVIRQTLEAVTCSLNPTE